MARAPYSELKEKIKELEGSEIGPGINWAWTYFNSGDKAAAFDMWAISHGYETQIYRPSPGFTKWGVRFR